MHSKSQNVKGWNPFNFQLFTFWFFLWPKILIYKFWFIKHLFWKLKKRVFKWVSTVLQTKRLQKTFNFQLSEGFCQLHIYTITQISWLVNNGLVLRKILQNIKPLTKKLVAQIQMCVQTILKCIFHEGHNVECPLIFGKPKNPYCSNIGQFNVFCCLWLRIANTNTLLKSS